MINESFCKMWNRKEMIYLIGLFILLTTNCHGRVHQGTHICEYYDRNICADCPRTLLDCSDLKSPKTNISYDKPNNYMQCFASWILTNATHPIPQKLGCWMNLEQCKNQRRCVDTRTDGYNMNFCCCDGDRCNTEFFHEPNFEAEREHRNRHRNTKSKDDRTNTGVGTPGVVRRAGEYELSKTILCSIVPIVAFFILVVTFYLMWRRHRRHPGHHQLPTMDPNLMHTPLEQALDIQLLEHKAKGRFGYVWKAKLIDQYVAVKIFPLADKKSFSAEVDIYKLPTMRHENILQFIGAQVKEESSYTEYFLITEYHDRGSLYDFLKANTITWAQLCQIGETMTAGLSYLHDEIPATHKTAMKPAVAHRDFKSKNVLIKSDLSACIADFGLALAFVPNMGVNETHTQVGTRRYMAPEVLEGAICFNMDSFLRIDMYACSLVLWELMTRCTCVEGVMDDYRLPFEAEVGLQPSLEEMQPLVVEQKYRPIIKPIWCQTPGMANLVETVEECWDQDAEARLLAGCVHDRIAQFSRTINTGGDNNASTNITTQLSASPPPFPGQQQQQQLLPQQQFIHEQQQQHCQYQQHPPPMVNNSLLSSNNQPHHLHHYLPNHLQHQQPPRVYVPNNSNHNNNNNNSSSNVQQPPPPPPPPSSVVIDHNININNINNSSNVNSAMNNTLSSSPMGMNMMTRDLSTC